MQLEAVPTPLFVVTFLIAKTGLALSVATDLTIWRVFSNVFLMFSTGIHANQGRIFSRPSSEY
jgi:hypothetical protein